MKNIRNVLQLSSKGYLYGGLVSFLRQIHMIGSILVSLIRLGLVHSISFKEVTILQDSKSRIVITIRTEPNGAESGNDEKSTESLDHHFSRTHPPSLIPALLDECASSDTASTGDFFTIDTPAVNLRRKRRRSKRLQDSLTDPHQTTGTDEPTPMKRRLFESLRILTIDIGASRTKFMYQYGTKNQILRFCESREMWSCPDGSSQMQMGKVFRQRLAGHLASSLPVTFDALDAVIFSVPGTVDLSFKGSDTATVEEDMCVVRNMPSMCPGFKGFNFKRGFVDLFPNAKIYAVADNMAAAMGVASDLKFKTFTSGLVVVLGTAPAVATFYRGKGDKEISKSVVELGIWQSWVWFTKIPLKDQYGYCGGLKMGPDGKTFILKDKSEYKIPHEKARIRFAIDRATWKRLRGRLDWIPIHVQGNLPKTEARTVFSDRVQASLNALALRFHQVYGRPDVVVVLGGNSTKCTGLINEATYIDPDFSRSEPHRIRVFIPDSDEEQMTIHMRGLAQAANYRISQVYANGTDPLARGWTRGGEIYMWVKRREIL